MGKSWEPYLVFIQPLLTETNSQGQSKHREDLRPSPTVINNELSINCDSRLTLGEKAAANASPHFASRMIIWEEIYFLPNKTCPI